MATRSTAKPAPRGRSGSAAAGRPTVPGSQPAIPDQPQAAPVHGVPVNAEQMQRLKQRATRSRKAKPATPAQDEDNPGC